MNDEIEFALADAPALGKCSAEVKVSLPEEIDEQLQFLAVAHGQTKSAYMRDVFTEHCLGKTQALKLRIQRPLRSDR